MPAAKPVNRMNPKPTLKLPVGKGRPTPMPGVVSPPMKPPQASMPTVRMPPQPGVGNMLPQVNNPFGPGADFKPGMGGISDGGPGGPGPSQSGDAYMPAGAVDPNKPGLQFNPDGSPDMQRMFPNGPIDPRQLPPRIGNMIGGGQFNDMRGRLDPKGTMPDSFWNQLNLDSQKPDPIMQSLNPSGGAVTGMNKPVAGGPNPYGPGGALQPKPMIPPQVNPEQQYQRWLKKQGGQTPPIAALPQDQANVQNPMNPIKRPRFSDGVHNFGGNG